jgi:ADP-ribosylglycohydrolase
MFSPTAAQRSGCLLGLALGDALGFVVEAQPSDVARAYVETELRRGRAGLRGHPGFPFGQYSDDTQLARELLLSVREAGRVDPGRFGRRLAALFTEGRDIGAGPGTRGAALRLAAGVPWEEAGTPAPYAGNGSAMRAAPLGLLIEDPDELIEAVVLQSRVTHQDPRCAAGALAIAVGAAQASRPGLIEPHAWLRELAGLLAQIDPPFAEAVRGISEWLKLDVGGATQALHASRFDPSLPDQWIGISAHVVPSVLWALYAFLRSPDSWWDTVCTAITVGGDTDTLAAMAGALSGSRLGRQGLPEELLARLNDRGNWGSDALAALAEPQRILQSGY